MSETTQPLRFEVRDTSGDGRTLTALLVPYAQQTEDTPVGSEVFEPRAFRRSIDHIRRSKQPLKLLRSHDQTKPVGIANRLEDTPEGPLGEFRIADTALGRETALEVREGLLDSMSVGFAALREKAVDGVRRIVEARLGEASLVAIGAYPGAKVLSLRDGDPSRIELPTRPQIAAARTIVLNGTRWTV